MSEKPIVSLLTLTDKDGDVKLQEGNLSFKYASRYRTNVRWWNGVIVAPSIEAFPFKNTYLLSDDDTGFGHGSWGHSSGINYPLINTVMGTVDYPHFRLSGTVATLASGSVPRVIGAVLGVSYSIGAISDFCRGDDIISQVDLPIDYTQIGTNIWQHPMTTFAASTVSTTLGANYITYTSASVWDQLYTNMGCLYIVRIESGADVGYYWVQHHDWTSKRLYLRCLNNTMFSALATASGITASVGPGRRAWFNEAGILQLSTGTLSTGGRFNPRKDDPYLRSSFIVRIIFEKSGSTEAAAGTEQQGSYRFNLIPWTHGDGILSGNYPDNACDFNMPVHLPVNSTSPGWFQFFAGNVNGMCLDWPNQRLWFGYTNQSNQSGIGFWRYITTEGFREVANYLGTATQASMLTPSIVLGAGDIIVEMEMGSQTGTSSNWCYCTINHASGGNAGVVIIKPDFTTLQYRLANGLPSSVIGASQVDTTRARSATSVITTGGGGTLQCATGSFTAADIGRAIKVTGATADNGTYLISAITSGTQVTVQTLASGAVTFTGGTGGTMEIGDRLYLFFNNGTTGAGKINYMESMAPGTFLARTVTMTNGANVNTRTTGSAGIRYGSTKSCSIDPATGDIYWLSNDTQQQINKYTVLTNTHSFLTIANVQSPSGGSPANPGAITLFTTIRVNSKFDDIWIGSDNGFIKLQKSNFAGANYKRYWGGEVPGYVNPTGFPRSDGAFTGFGNSNSVRALSERCDGRMVGILGSSSIHDRVMYSQDADNWTLKIASSWSHGDTTGVYREFYDPYGRMFSISPASALARFYLCQHEVEYQWDSTNSKWIQLEVSHRSMPNKATSDTSNPFCKCKPIHSTFDDLIFGAQVKFNRQGGATPANNEFLGRGGQSRTTTSDGGTTSTSATFTGSGFSAGDVGKLLRIESGADANIYKITVYTNSSTVTLANMNGTAFSASATAGSLVYTVWDLGTPGANAGPENVTFYLADGVALDNVQDLTGITYDNFNFKSRNYENSESRKFCVESPLAIPGSTATAFYYETYPVAAANYDSSNSHHRALPGAEFTNGRQALDFFVDKVLNGSGGRAIVDSSPANGGVWNGNTAASTLGYSAMVDFGKDVEVGYIQIRVSCNAGSYAYLCANASNNGLLANIYKATNAGGTPVASSSIRTSGSANVSITLNTTTLSVSSGDLLGSAGTTGSNGSTTAGQSTFICPVATFASSDFMKVLKVTSGGDTGSYRIIVVSADGSTVTVRNLDQTAKAWTTSASGLGYTVYDAVREEDMIAIPSLAAPTHKLCIERLLSTTTAQVRIGPSATVTNQNWQCVKPSWDLVKRISQSTEAVPPDVSNNGTWISAHGRENAVGADAKIYADFTDLTPSQRTGRYWKYTAMPRFATSAGNTQHYMSTMEFYDPTGAKLAISKYDWTDQALQNTDFFYSYVTRVDFIQAANDACSAISGTNGLASLGGANLDTITLSGGNKFLGFQIGVGISDGNLVAGGSVINSASSSFPANAMVGRFVRITSGANAGNFYRVASRVSATQITVSTPSGGVVTWAGSESGITMTFHEGINVGGTYPDKFVFLSDGREYTIATINDTLTTITVSESLTPARTNLTWEIRRPAYDTSSSTTDATKSARLVRPGTTYPLQSGDVAHDSRGALRYFAEDIGTGFQRADGATTISTGTFTGSSFTPDDVGRLLYVQSGADKGIYEISAYSNSTTITVKNHYTGAATSFTANASTLTYQIFGDRRFRISKYVTGLRA